MRRIRLNSLGNSRRVVSLRTVVRDPLLIYRLPSAVRFYLSFNSAIVRRDTATLIEYFVSSATDGKLTDLQYAAFSLSPSFSLRIQIFNKTLYSVNFVHKKIFYENSKNNR